MNYEHKVAASLASLLLSKVLPRDSFNGVVHFKDVVELLEDSIFRGRTMRSRERSFECDVVDHGMEHFHCIDPDVAHHAETFGGRSRAL